MLFVECVLTIHDINPIVPHNRDLKLDCITCLNKVFQSFTVHYSIISYFLCVFVCSSLLICMSVYVRVCVAVHLRMLIHLKA